MISCEFHFALCYGGIGESEKSISSNDRVETTEKEIRNARFRRSRRAKHCLITAFYDRPRSLPAPHSTTDLLRKRKQKLIPRRASPARFPFIDAFLVFSLSFPQVALPREERSTFWPIDPRDPRLTTHRSARIRAASIHGMRRGSATIKARLFAMIAARRERAASCKNSLTEGREREKAGHGRVKLRCVSTKHASRFVQQVHEAFSSFLQNEARLVRAIGARSRRKYRSFSGKISSLNALFFPPPLNALRAFQHLA